MNKFNSIFNSTIKNKTILIFEPNRYHFECLPGYAKYFIDLGYKIDILTRSFGINAFFLFNEIDKIRFFVYENLKSLYKYAKKFPYSLLNIKLFIKKYDFIVVQTTDEKNKNLFIHLNLLSLNNTIFIFHNKHYIDNNYSEFFNRNHAWTLGNISKGILVNPHYFGNISIKDKKKKTIFFLTSTKNRNYKYLVKSLIKLKKDNLKFEIIVVGNKNYFNIENIPKTLIRNFHFKFGTTYDEMYKCLVNADYIIIPFDPKNKNDISYKTVRVSGSIQLSYGFLKPVIIDKNFAEFYSFNCKNSLIYENYDFYTIMKKAIKLNNKEYKYFQNNLNDTVKEIYKISINNVKKSIYKNNK